MIWNKLALAFQRQMSFLVWEITGRALEQGYLGQQVSRGVKKGGKQDMKKLGTGICI